MVGECKMQMRFTALLDGVREAGEKCDAGKGRTQEHMKPPREDTYKINLDGSFDPNNKSCYGGGCCSS
jgi:hypothetical protein